MKFYASTILVFISSISQKSSSMLNNYIRYNANVRINWAGQLCDAAERGHSDAVKHYLDAGIDPNSVSDGLTPLMYVCDRCYYNDDKKADLTIVQDLLSAGADPNLICSWRADNTALHMAVTHYKSEIVAELLNAGANFRGKNFYGWSALYVAYNEAWRCSWEYKMAEKS